MSNIQDSKNILNIGGNLVVQGDVIVGDGAQKVQLASGPIQLPPSDYLKDLPEIAANIKFPNQPFIGLRWFTRVDARIFFGRGKMIKTLYDLLHTPTADDLILMYGQSGVGKSSLLHAGLFPRLEQDWTVIYERRNQEVLISEVLEKRLATLSNEKKIIVIIDQLEEVLTVPNAKTSEELILLHDFIQKKQKTHSNIKWIASFRKEFVAEMEVVFQDFPFTKLFVPPLQQEGIMEAVVGVTANEDAKQKYQLTIEEGLAEKIASDIFRDQSSHIAPALQVLLTKFWGKTKQKNPNAPHFSHEDYEEFVRENGLLLDEFLGEQLKKLPAKYLDSGLALDLLYFYTTPLATAAEHSQQELLDRYVHLSKEELKTLVTNIKNLYLLTDNRDDNHQRLAHDALAPLVIQRHHNSITKGQRARSILENRIKNSPKEGLIALNAPDLKAVEAGKEGMRIWTAKEQELVNISRQNISRQKLIRNIALGVLGILLASTLLLLFLQRRNDLKELERQEIELFKYQAENATDPSVQYQLYRDILAKDENDEATKNKLYQLRRENIFYENVPLSNADNDFRKVAISPDGKQWAVYYKNGETHRIDRYIYNKENLTYQSSINEATSASLEVLQFSADGQSLLGGGNDHMLHRWNTAGQDFPSDKLGDNLEYKIETLAISPDGKWAIASFFEQEVILLYDIEKQHVERYLELGEASALQFLGNSYQFVAALRDGRVIQYNIRKKEETLFYESKIAVSHLAFHSPSSTLVIADKEGMLLFGNLEQDLSFEKAHENSITDLQFSKDGRLLLTASKDQTAKLWHLKNEEGHYQIDLLHTLQGHQAAVSQVGFSEEEKTIFTVADQIRTWQLPIVLPEQIFASSSTINDIARTKDFVFAATNRNGILFWDKALNKQKTALQNISTQKITALAADEQFLIAGEETGKTYCWQSDNQLLLDSFSDIHQASIGKILLSKKHLAILAEDKTISIWDKQSRSNLSKLQHTANVLDMTFAEDENALYSISADGKLQAWSLEDFQAEIRYENFETDFTHLLYQTDNQQLITTTSSDSLQFWQTNGTLIKQIALPASVESLVALSEGRIAVGTADGYILILDATGNAYQQLKLGAESLPTDLFWQDKQLLVATENGQVQIWKIEEPLK